MTRLRRNSSMLGKRVIAAIAASVALAATPVVGPMVGAANGSLFGVATAEAKTVFGNTDGLDISLIDNGRLADVTFTLTGENPFDDLPKDELPAASLAGYRIVVTQIAGIDPRVALDRQRAALFTVEGARLLPHGITKSAVTDEHGFATISGIPVGLYLVEATPPRADNAHRYKHLSPFLLMLPTGGIEGWDYVPAIALKEVPEDPPVIPTPPATATPSVPVTPERPVTPGEPGKPGQPQNNLPGVLGRLPMTGAEVISTLVASACFIAAGAVFLWFGLRRRNADNSGLAD